MRRASVSNGYMHAIQPGMGMSRRQPRCLDGASLVAVCRDVSSQSLRNVLMHELAIMTALGANLVSPCRKKCAGMVMQGL